jgi:hypothetical protein
MHHLLSYTASPGRVTSFFAPSWSWMLCQVSGGFLHPGGELGLLAEIFITETTPSAINPFRAVSPGSITLAGVLIRDYALHENTSLLQGPHDSELCIYAFIGVPLIRVNIQEENGSQTITTRRAVRDKQSTETSFSVIPPHFTSTRALHERSKSASSLDVSGLLMGRPTSHPGAFERLGISLCSLSKLSMTPKRAWSSQDRSRLRVQKPIAHQLPKVFIRHYRPVVGFPVCK